MMTSPGKLVQKGKSHLSDAELISHTYWLGKVAMKVLLNCSKRILRICKHNLNELGGGNCL